MITGDSKHTAVAVAKELEILHQDDDVPSTCFTGGEFAAMNDK